MSSPIDGYLPDSHGERVFVFVVLFLVVLPLALVLSQNAPYVLTTAIGVGFVAWLVHRSGLLGDGGTDEAATDADPMTTLQDRYASGEIDEEEFERRLERLVELEDRDLADVTDDAEAVLEPER